jgi:hypothetical protein
MIMLLYCTSTAASLINTNTYGITIDDRIENRSQSSLCDLTGSVRAQESAVIGSWFQLKFHTKWKEGARFMLQL